MTIPDLFIQLTKLLEHQSTQAETLKRVESQLQAIIIMQRKERQTNSARLSQLRTEVAELKAERSVRQALTAELQRVYGEPVQPLPAKRKYTKS